MYKSLIRDDHLSIAMSRCDREVSVMWKAWPTRGCCAMGKNPEKGRVKQG